LCVFFFFFRALVSTGTGTHLIMFGIKSEAHSFDKGLLLLTVFLVGAPTQPVAAFARLLPSAVCRKRKAQRPIRR
jgi:hypothetical protein